MADEELRLALAALAAKYYVFNWTRLNDAVAVWLQCTSCKRRVWGPPVDYLEGGVAMPGLLQSMEDHNTECAEPKAMMRGR